MSVRRIDVSQLPTVVFGLRDPVSWGVLGLIAIESTMVVLLVAAYLYLRANFDAWPPNEIGPVPTRIAAAEALVVLLSAVPTHYANAAAVERRLRPMRSWLLGATVLIAIMVALRAWEFRALPFRWDAHAHGSAFWMLLGLNTFHVLGGLVENIVLLAILFRGPVEAKLPVDIQSSGFYWYFVVVTSVVIFGFLYLEPLLVPR
jgi:heme/copper-type cytochrome/quinol oxidase subunit 3